MKPVMWDEPTHASARCSGVRAPLHVQRGSAPNWPPEPRWWAILTRVSAFCTLVLQAAAVLIVLYVLLAAAAALG